MRISKHMWNFEIIRTGSKRRHFVGQQDQTLSLLFIFGTKYSQRQKAIKTCHNNNTSYSYNSFWPSISSVRIYHSPGAIDATISLQQMLIHRFSALITVLTLVFRFFFCQEAFFCLLSISVFTLSFSFYLGKKLHPLFRFPFQSRPKIHQLHNEVGRSQCQFRDSCHHL